MKLIPIRNSLLLAMGYALSAAIPQALCNEDGSDMASLLGFEYIALSR
ncbi:MULTISPECIES: hypothetical protein [unclassified Nostoc]|nr:MULTISPECIES: hypothetical protein [unclassified Nostoc]MDZ8029515.1 hypothetical protein [Nostoc sp. DedSLP04]MDZ8128674.1 hypothetical protein [Nostoc sp. DedQUE07]